MQALAGWALLALLVPGANGNTDEAAARALAKKGEESYRAGRLEEAARLLEQAYELDPEPVLLLNLARVLDSAGELKTAAERYREYLKVAPHPQDRPLIERRIETIEGLLAERRALESRPPPPSPPPPAPPQIETPPPIERHTPVAPWAIAGVGGAGLVTGTVFAVLAARKQRQAEDEPVQAESARLLSTARTFGTVRTVSLAVGGVMVVGGVLWALLADADQEPAVAVHVGPGSIAVEIVSDFP